MDRAKPVRAGIPVICVGNLVAGGAGKTPVAIAVARHLIAAGLSPHFLSRGYGGRKSGPLRVDPAQHDAGDVGDEPLLLAREAPCWIARDRPAGARAAVADGAGLIVMDDGFQNPSLHKDVSLLVIDGQSGFGNGRLMPAGPLRERPVDAISRASAAILMGDDTSGVGALLARHDVTVIRAGIVPEGDTGWLRGRNVVAFAGIARPEKFFATLIQLGANLVARFAFADHQRIPTDDFMRMVELASGAGAVLMTTTKDHVRLPADSRQMVKALTVSVRWEDEDAITRVLMREG
jgi:tetraacyldisaccharide 4'-kinase